MIDRTFTFVCKSCEFQDIYHEDDGKPKTCHVCGSKDTKLLRICGACNKEFEIKRRKERACPDCVGNTELKSFRSYCDRRPDAIIPFELFCDLKARDCEICGWQYSKDIHHVDGNYKNNAPENLITLCRNHHDYMHRVMSKAEQLNRLVKELSAVV